MGWFYVREIILGLATTPALFLIIGGILLTMIAKVMRLVFWKNIVFSLTGTLLPSVIYSPIGTNFMSMWLTKQIDISHVIKYNKALVVILGRGEKTSSATTHLAADLEKKGYVNHIYVSGETPYNANRLLKLGVPKGKITVDETAKTTWENAIVTSDWIRRQRIYTNNIILITDNWQLARAAKCFNRRGIRVIPMPVKPILTKNEQNKLAIRETTAMIIYIMLGRV
jgi:uncharacterized SAM-binding protein YcdF (DUF218 family)